jgi:hypothetical protein
MAQIRMPKTTAVMMRLTIAMPRVAPTGSLSLEYIRRYEQFDLALL